MPKKIRVNGPLPQHSWPRQILDQLDGEERQDLEDHDALVISEDSERPTPEQIEQWVEDLYGA